MASGLPDELPDGFVNTVSVCIDHKLGELTWVMDDNVAMAFNALPEEERRRRIEFLQHLLKSTSVVLTAMSVAHDIDVTYALSQGADKVATTANNMLLRMTIMA